MEAGEKVPMASFWAFVQDRRPQQGINLLNTSTFYLLAIPSFTFTFAFQGLVELSTLHVTNMVLWANTHIFLFEECISYLWLYNKLPQNAAGNQQALLTHKVISESQESWNDSAESLWLWISQDSSKAVTRAAVI